MLASLDFAALSSLGLGWGAALLVGFAYLLGSVPFGLLIGRWRGVDLRTVGSGNIGATNAARAMGRGFGLVVYLLDVGKGLVPVLLAGQVAAGEQALAAVQGLSPLAALSGGQRRRDGLRRGRGCRSLELCRRWPRVAADAHSQRLCRPRLHADVRGLPDRLVVATRPRGSSACWSGAGVVAHRRPCHRAPSRQHRPHACGHRTSHR